MWWCSSFASFTLASALCRAANPDHGPKINRDLWLLSVHDVAPNRAFSVVRVTDVCLSGFTFRGAVQALQFLFSHMNKN